MARKPNFRVAALNKVTDERGNIGAAWSNPDGTISIRFDPWVTVPQGKDIVITMFPTKEETEGNPSKKRTKKSQIEIPF